MSEPGSSGKAGPTPISASVQGTFGGEQERPAFHFGPHEVRLGDQIQAYHRTLHKVVAGTVVVLYGTLCISCGGQFYPLERLVIREVQPPLFE